MPKYDPELIRRVSEENDIVDIISEYVPLKRRGSSYTACCPFHNEKTPSFHVDREKQLFHCFGCGIGGNLYTFIMEKENLSFPEAVKYLANKAGITLPTTYSKKQQRNYDKRNRLYEINRLSGNFFYKNLKNNQNALNYLKERELDENVLKEFAIGYAPDNWSVLTNSLKKYGFTIKEIVDSGIAISNANNRVYDRFRNRIIFPIQNVMDKVIGFGARKISDEDQGPKYLNSPETLIFSKGTQLYNFNRAKKLLKNQPLILVEGYMDVIALSKYGIKNTAAALGTAFTKDHIKLISRYTKDVILCFDGDKAGENATIKALSVLTGSDLNIKIVRLPVEHDPDTYIKTFGKDKFDDYLNNALTELDFKLLILENKFNLSTSGGIINYVNESCNLLSSLDVVVQEEYAKKIAAKVNLSLSTILDRIKDKGVVIPALKKEKKVTKNKIPQELKEAQKNFLLFCYQVPDTIQSLEITEEMLTSGFFRWFFNKLKRTNQPKIPLTALILDEEDKKYESMASKFLMLENNFNLDFNTLESSIDIIEKYFRQRKIKELQDQLLTADQKNKEKIFDQLIELKKVDWIKK